MKGRGLRGVLDFVDWAFLFLVMGPLLFVLLFVAVLSDGRTAFAFSFGVVGLVAVWRNTRGFRGRARLTDHSLEWLSENTLRKNVVPLDTVAAVLIVRGIAQVRIIDVQDQQFSFRLSRRVQSAAGNKAVDAAERVLREALAGTDAEISGLEETMVFPERFMRARPMPKPTAWVKPDRLEWVVLGAYTIVFCGAFVLGIVF